MVEWIEGVKCFHSIACGLIISTLLGVTIQANVSYSSDVCDPSGKHFTAHAPGLKCIYTTERVWTLILFYCGAFVFIVGSLGTCMNNGYVIIFHMICVGTWATAGIVIMMSRMSDDKSMSQAFFSITEEVIRSEWKVWATVIWWELGICLSITITAGIVISIYFIQYHSIQ